MAGVVHSFVDNVDGIAIVATQDVQPYLDANKAAQNDGTNGYTPSRDFRKKASVPLVVVEKWMNDYGVDVFDPNHALAVKRLLASSEWRYLRTSTDKH